MRLLIVFLILGALFTIPFLIWGEGFEARFSTGGTIEWLEGHGRWAWAAALALLCADIVLPVPSTAVIAALGFVYGPVAGALIGAAGSIAAGSLAYTLCRLIGRRAATWIAGEHDLVRGEQFMARLGPWAVAISRWLPLLPEVVACLAGLVRMRPIVFHVALACGAVPMAAVFAVVGATGVERPALAIGLSAAVPCILWPIARWMLERRSR